MGRAFSSRMLRRRIWTHKYGTNYRVPCCYCGLLLTFESATTEHIQPIAKGGTDDLANLDIACPLCNEQPETREDNKKDHTLAREFIASHLSRKMQQRSILKQKIPYVSTMFADARPVSNYKY